MRDSIWRSEQQVRGNQRLKSHRVPVAIIGGGLTGVLTAYLLAEQGIHAEVFEARTVGSGKTCNTTAKITSQHRLIYDRLIREFGIEKAREYASYNEHAISKYESIIKGNRIDCDFKKAPAYVYTTKDPANIQAEVKAAKRVGINAYYTTDTELPFEVTGAVCFQNQAMFHPIKFLNGIAKDLTIWEYAKVIRIRKHTLEVLCKRENQEDEIIHIEADKIVIATHYPVFNRPGYYFMRMYQERSYVVAVKEKEGLLDGMYVGESNSDYSFRRYGEFILIGGENHRTGLELDKDHFKELRQVAKSYYKDAQICYEWANQDCIPLDGIPYIGLFSKRREDIYVATGYSKWGMTTSMVAASMITEYIGGAAYREDSIFSPSRFDYRSSKQEGKKHIRVSVRSMLKPAGRIKTGSLAKIPKGSAGVIWHKARRIGVYHDLDGTIYAVSLRCPHLGCRLSWNPEEKSWDCPCHGSRFDYKGDLISNPANRGAAKKHKNIQGKR